MASLISNKNFEYRVSMNCSTSLNQKDFMIGKEINELDAEHLFDDDVLCNSANVNSVDLNEQCVNLCNLSNDGRQFVRIDTFDDDENYDDYEISVLVEPSVFQPEIDEIDKTNSSNNGVGIVFGYERPGTYFKLEWVCNEYSCASETLNELRLVQVIDHKEKLLSKSTLHERPSYRSSPAFREKVKMAVKVRQDKDLIVGITSYAEIICKDVKPPKINDFGLFSWDNEIGIVFESLEVKEYI
jgi:hypothetical protein